jgi:hypothetical protein
MKAITIDSLNICIFSFVSFSSMAVMLISRGTPYAYVPDDTSVHPEHDDEGANRSIFLEIGTKSFVSASAE